MAQPKDVTTVLNKWLTNSKNGVTAYRSGVQRVTEAPTQAAARQLPKYLAKVQEAVSSGKMAAALQRSTLSDYQTACLGKGATNYAVGIDAAKAKVQSSLSKMLPYAAQLKEQIASMPSSSFEDGMQRVRAAAQGMKDFWAGQRGG